MAAMSKIFDDIRREAAEKAAEKATERTTEQLTVAHLISIMRNLGFTFDQAMDLLSVPEQEWEKYAELVVERMKWMVKRATEGGSVGEGSPLTGAATDERFIR